MHNFVAIDFETANNDKHSACAIGVSVVRNGEIESEKYVLIRPPELKFSGVNIAIHGIQRHHVEHEKSFQEHWYDWLLPLLQDQIVVAHNAKFDIAVLQACMSYYNLGDTLPCHAVFCSVELAKEFLPRLKNHKLHTVASFFDIELNHHNALSDASACANLVLRMFRNTDCTLKKALKPDDQKIEQTIKQENNRKSGYNDYLRQLETSSSREYQFDLRNTPPRFRFDNTHFVFTGCLDRVNRYQAEEVMRELGAIVKENVTRQTNYVVIGGTDKMNCNESELTGKHRKAIEYIKKGIPIILWNESEFLQALGLVDNDTTNF
ncbi:MAG: exonuclease domain-containing protein [Thermoguttaceae bacterium]